MAPRLAGARPNMTLRYNTVFLLGRPGSGKTAVYRELERQLRETGSTWTIERFDDFPKLRARFRSDDAREREGKQRLDSRRTAEGHYTLTNRSVLDDILREISAEVIDRDRRDHGIVIEFARPSYVEALSNFHPHILDRSLVVYVEASFETCRARNLARREAGGDKDGDDHVIAPEAMDAVFRRDDREALVRHLQERGIPVWVVDNEADGEDHLKKQVEELLRALLPSSAVR